MTKREKALNSIRLAGYHGDDGRAAELYIENRIAYPVYREWLQKGRKAKENGVPCGCDRCKGEGADAAEQSAKEAEF